MKPENTQKMPQAPAVAVQRFVVPLERRRKPGLGNYTGTRADWVAAWRRARVRHRQGMRPDPKDKNLEWKAALTVAYDRSDVCDPLSISVWGRLEAMRAVQAILGHNTERTHGGPKIP